MRSIETAYEGIMTAPGVRERRERIAALEAQHYTVSSAVGRLLVANIQGEEAVARQMGAMYDTGERNVYLFMTAMLSSIAAIGLGAAHYNRRLFARLEALSEQRSTLARRLIGMQEEIFRSVSRELHDDFGQILTAIGTMLRHIEKRNHTCTECSFTTELREVRDVAQEALEKTRTFSQALHPAILDDYGIGRAVERQIANFQKQTGIQIRLEKSGVAVLPEDKAIHVFRILQEALNNIGKHSGAKLATVRLKYAVEGLDLEVEDDGVGMSASAKQGLGLTAMRERAEIVGGSIGISKGGKGGTLIKLKVPVDDSKG
jgi:signal transduction histidine kinase